MRTYDEKPVSDVIQRLQEEYKAAFSRENCILYDKIYDKAYRQEGKTAIEKQAEAFCSFLNKKQVRLSENDIFAGQIQHYLMRFSQPFPEEGNPEEFDPSVIHTGGANSFVNAQKTVDMCSEYLDDEEKKELSFLADGVEAGYFTHYPVGHVITGFEFVLHRGFKNIRKLIENRLKQDGLSREQRDTGRAMYHTVRACQEYILRYKKEAEILAEMTKTPENKCRLSELAETLGRLSEKPAGSFYEALQFSVLLQELILTQTKGSMSFGRIDRLLYEYYRQDELDAVQDKKAAQQLIDAWMIKIAGCIGGFQNITLGGCDEDGKYCGNEVSMMFLSSSRRLGYDQPLISYRITKDLPALHWEEIQRTIQKGGGFPALFHDEVIIESKMKLGIIQRDARNYGIVGCVEPSICGKEFSFTEALRINWGKTLELMMNGGTCPVTGKQLFLKENRELDSIQSFEEFYKWYKSELFYAIERAARICILTERSFYKCYPSTLLSVTLEGGIQRLEDCGNRGTVYCNSAINHTGTANAADSLMAIKRVVFEEKKVTLKEYRDILNHNYMGKEEFRRGIKEDIPKYGNDNEQIDRILRELVNETAEKTQSIKNERGGIFLAGYYSVYHHAALGALTGALPDGRLRGEALANGLSPVQGADHQSPLAVIHSMCGLEQSLFGNGMVLDIKFSPSFFEGESHHHFLRPFLEVYFDQGGMELQLNIVDRQTLLNAKKNPEHYRNLLVRVSGFSAYFVNLSEQLQDEIIKRTEYGKKN